MPWRHLWCNLPLFFFWSAQPYSINFDANPKLSGFQRNLDDSWPDFYLTQEDHEKCATSEWSEWSPCSQSCGEAVFKVKMLKCFCSTSLPLAWNVKNWTWGCWVRSKYATSVQCSPPSCFNLIYFFKFSHSVLIWACFTAGSVARHSFCWEWLLDRCTKTTDLLITLPLMRIRMTRREKRPTRFEPPSQEILLTRRMLYRCAAKQLCSVVEVLL